MEIGQTLNTAAPTGPTPAAGGTVAPINSDFEMFLQMLTAQMKYQDPLNPVDSTDYATQLATFSGVEQAVLTNDLLKSLSSEMNAGGLADMAAWVGKDARAAPADKGCRTLHSHFRTCHRDILSTTAHLSPESRDTAPGKQQNEPVERYAYAAHSG